MKYYIFTYLFGFMFGIIAAFSGIILFPMSQEEIFFLMLIAMGIMLMLILIAIPNIKQGSKR